MSPSAKTSTATADAGQRQGPDERERRDLLYLDAPKQWHGAVFEEELASEDR